MSAVWGGGGDSHMWLAECQCPLYGGEGGAVTCGLLNDCLCPLYGGGGGAVTCGLLNDCQCPLYGVGGGSHLWLAE